MLKFKFLTHGFVKLQVGVAILSLTFLTACGNPFGGSHSQVDVGHDPGVSPVATPTSAVPSPSLSLVSVSAASVNADGSTTVTVTVTLLDPVGKPIFGDPIFLNSSRAVLDVITPSFALTNGAGVASFAVKSLYAGVSTFSAQETLNSIALAQTAIVTFTGWANSVSATQSSVAASVTSVVDNGTSNSKVMVVLSDASGNSVPGKTVTLTSSRGAADTITPASGVSNSSGLVTFTVTSTLAGSATFSAVDATDSISISPSTATVTFVPGPASLISINSGNTQSATVNTAVTNPIVVKVTDSTNNAVTGATVNWAIASGAGSLSAASNATNASGLTQVNWTLGTVSGANTATATINGTATAVTFTATGNASATTHFGVTGFTTPATASLSYPFTVTALDTYGNVVPTYAGTVTFTSSDGSASLPVNTTLVSGSKTVNATLNKVLGLQSITAADTVTSGITGSQSGITVNATASTPTQLQVSGATTNLTAGTCYGFTVTSQNTGGAAVNAVWPINLSLLGNDLGIFYSDACVTSASSLQILVGQSTTTFYYRNLYSEAGLSLQAVDAAQVLTTGSISVASISAVPTQIFSAPVSYSNFALLNTGALWSFGNNNGYLLGNNLRTGVIPVPVPVQNLTSSVLSVGAGSYHTCVVLAGGTVKCWGDNSAGQFGNGTFVSSLTAVSGGNGVTTGIAIGGGWAHTCVLLSGGTVQCWGDNSYGQLGNGSAAASSNVPVTVSGITTATAISVGDENACALLASGAVKCWGYNAMGQLGNNSVVNSNTPVSVSGIAAATAIAVGVGQSCAIISGGTVQCWGWNTYGQLGNGLFANSLVPVNVTGIASAIAIATGQAHVCVILSGGSMKCWGYNANGQLGNNTIIDSSVPVSVSGIISATSIVAGMGHTCSLNSTGSAVRCWGASNMGQLGVGPIVTNILVPTAVPGLALSPATQLLLLDGQMNYFGSYAGLSACTSLVVMGTSASGGQSTALASNTTINLTTVGDPGLKFYSDSACSVQSSTLVIPSGASSAKTYFNNPAYNNSYGCATAPNATINAQSQDGTLSVSTPLDVDFYNTGGCGC